MSEKMQRGREILLYINRKKVRGVLSLSIKTNTERRMLKEYLSEEPYAVPVKNEIYRIAVTTLIRLRGTDQPFVITVGQKGEGERYENCTVSEMREEIAPDDYIRYTYLIESGSRRKGGCLCGK